MSSARVDSVGLVDSGGLVDLGQLERVAGEWCGRADPARLSGADAAVVAERLAVVQRRLAAKQASMAARAADCNAYASRVVSAEAWLARHNGTSRSDAKRMLDTARRLHDCPPRKPRSTTANCPWPKPTQ